ncbi:MFS transporter [Kitasatospora aureofaciens]|uniref:MFS transporter n=1 Tax=Kitasatospora aureofaciens TaxID=1894 RepID=UPI001C470CCF|nr:MFS transporter [Kitasatospora aureofaciens]MBV6701906.1 MFS transporter [Kitasatospora aureofaciens]
MGGTREPRRWWVLAAMSGALAMTFIDETGVGVALATIRRELHTSPTGVHWVMNAYMLTLAALVAASGRLADVFGRRRVFAVGLVVFGAGSLLSATAPGLPLLVAWRAVQGVGAALLIPTALTIVAGSFPPAERGRAVGTYIGAASVFYVVGPLVTGALTQEVGWRAVFWVNVPLACAVGVVAALAVAPDPPVRRRERLDVVGLLTDAAGLGALVVALMEGPALGWASPAVPALGAGAVLLLAVFVLAERRRTAPLFDLTLLRRGPLACAVGMVFLVYVVYLGLIVFVPLFLQHEAGLRPLAAGLALTLALGPIIAVAPVNGRIVDRSGARRPALVAALTALVSFAWLALAAPAHSFPLLLPALLLYGVSIPAVYNTAVTVAQNLAPDAQRGQVSGLLGSAAQAGAAIGVAVIGAVVVAVSGSADYTTAGFRAGFGLCAVLSLVLVPLALALPRRPPAGG